MRAGTGNPPQKTASATGRRTERGFLLLGPREGQDLQVHCPPREGLRDLPHAKEIRRACAQESPRPAFSVCFQLDDREQFRSTLDFVNRDPLRAHEQGFGIANRRVQGGELVEGRVPSRRPDFGGLHERCLARLPGANQDDDRELRQHLGKPAPLQARQESLQITHVMDDIQPPSGCQAHLVMDAGMSEARVPGIAPQHPSPRTPERTASLHGYLIPEALAQYIARLFPALEFLDQLLQHLPNARAHLVRRCGLYCSRSRGTWSRRPWLVRLAPMDNLIGGPPRQGQPSTGNPL